LSTRPPDGTAALATEALLVMDVQNGVVEHYASQPEPLLSALQGAVSAARAAGVQVIYVRVAFREGAPEISPRNLLLSAVAKSGGMGETEPATQVHAAIAPQPGDIVITKKRVSAFAGSDLDVVLRSLGIESLVLSGIATSGVVLSTLRQASDLDFEITVLRDGCDDTDAEVHRVLLDKVFPRQATVVTSDEWIAHLGRGPSATS
jgi:nicotinamidase-related amidase